jgi:hypothetical protein
VKRTLNLRRETLAELNPADLVLVVGGAQTGNGHTCPILQCYGGTQPWQTCNCCTASASC